MGTGVLDPYLVGRTVDEIRGGGADLWPLALAVAAAGVLRLAFSVSRRLVAGRVSLGVEYDLRNRMYEHLHSLELALLRRPADRPADVARDGRPAGGALLPRLRPDLHRAVGAHDPDRGGRDVRASTPAWPRSSLAPMPFVIWVAFRYGRLNRPATPGGAAAHRRADRGGRGERRRRARGQGLRAGGAPAAALRPRRSSACSTSRWSPPGCAPSTRPLIGFLPQLGLAALLFVGGRQAIDGRDHRSASSWPSTATCCCSPRPMRMLGMALGMAQRAVASGARVFELLDREPRLTAPRRTRPPLPRGRRARGAARRDASATTAASRCCADIDLDGRGRAHGGARGPDRLRQDHARDADPAPLRRRRGARAGGRRRRALGRPGLAAARGGGGLRRRLPVLRQPARQHRLRAPRGERRRGACAAAERAGPRRAASTTCPTASTRSSASAA